jgi:hypothetical protein
MQSLIHFIGALILAYAISRLTRFLPLSPHPYRALFANHALAFALILGLLAVLRLPVHAFGLEQVAQAFLAQMVWLIMDAARQNWPRLKAG